MRKDNIFLVIDHSNSVTALPEPRGELEDRRHHRQLLQSVVEDTDSKDSTVHVREGGQRAEWFPVFTLCPPGEAPASTPRVATRWNGLTGHRPQGKEDDNRMVIARTQDTLKLDIAITSKMEFWTSSRP